MSTGEANCSLTARSTLPERALKSHGRPGARSRHAFLGEIGDSKLTFGVKVSVTGCYHPPTPLHLTLTLAGIGSSLLLKSNDATDRLFLRGYSI